MKQLKSVILFIVLLMTASACSNANSTTGSEQSETPGDQELNEPANKEGADNEEEGREETGKLVIYTSGSKDLAEKLIEGFEEKTGINVDMFEGTTGQILGRLEAEENNPLADVVVLASLPPAMEYKEKGLILPYESPYASQLHDGWYDEAYYYYGFSASALGLSYNTKLVDTPPADWADLLDEQYKGLLAIPDPTESGTARDFIAAYINQEGEAGWELYRDLKANGLKLGGANNPALASVISGTNSVVMAGVDYMVYSSKENGEPVDIVFPESGTTITPRPAFILESANNITSAQQYIDYILSDEGQQIVAEAYLLPARTDIEPHESRAPLSDIKELNYDWGFLEENTSSILDEFMNLVR
ncbi:iron(III) transport system substrate-binding protein [Evansella caseinilytica]|uniref:Iron(III) transport system substrate-binding protein n=1 Tax=Evansella caseinilytica TaxID=1503961 RepID=A0A1H3U4Q9_9BACI|nr:ABC transporter substrate-binding protein [Evansella caseinilytica]SDZ57456.1 iron(III) transport system substrate-binding protein [Evansella caseinilytica]